MEADDAGAVGLHDEVAAIGFAVLEFVGHEGLEVEDFLEALAPQVPDVEACLRQRGCTCGCERRRRPALSVVRRSGRRGPGCSSCRGHRRD